MVVVPKLRCSLSLDKKLITIFRGQPSGCPLFLFLICGAFLELSNVLPHKNPSFGSLFGSSIIISKIPALANKGGEVFAGFCVILHINSSERLEFLSCRCYNIVIVACLPSKFSLFSI